MITLSNIHEFTDEQVFDYVYAKLAEQGKRSGTRSRCYYLSDDGSKCAVGLMMDDYQKEFDYCKRDQNIEGRVVWNSMPLVRILKDFYPNAVPRFHLLTVLQAAHDYFNPELWVHIFPSVRAALFEGKSHNIEGYLAKVIKAYHESI